MNHQSRRYGVYRYGNGRYLYSTMTAGIRNLDHRPRLSKKRRIGINPAALFTAVRRYRAVYFVAAIAFATQGFVALMSLSTLLLIISLFQRKKAAKESK